MKYLRPFIPKDAKWFLAEIVMEFTFEGEQDNIVWVNLVLVRADSPEDAYEKALLLGQDGEDIYDNNDGKKVTIRFCGLRDLLVIYEELEHGAEILYTEYENVSADALAKMNTPKAQLSVFDLREVSDDE